MSKKVLPSEFLTAFKAEWETSLSEQELEVLKAYESCSEWTHLMLRHDGFLSKVMNRLGRNLVYKREYYTIDALYVGGEDLFRNDRAYPSDIHTLIEHEQGYNVEEEMWKLIFWRSPLKIIIFYDWNESEKTDANGERSNWLPRKLEKFKAMLDTANKFHGEAADTSYLFIIGNRSAEGHLPQWVWASTDQTIAACSTQTFPLESAGWSRCGPMVFDSDN